MLAFSAPGFLIAGMLLATVPVALHMLARTPPERRPLPTARFLTVDRRTRLRLRPPADRLLLALRVLFLLLLATAFAQPEWQPDRTGSTAVVLLDAGSGMDASWDDAVDAAAARLAEGGALVVFDTTARSYLQPDAAILDSVRSAGPGAAPSAYLAALRGLRTAAQALPVDSASAVLVTRPRWSAWSPALPFLREAAWPASIELLDAAPADGSGAETTAVDERDTGAPRPATILGAEDHPLRPFVSAALRSLGYALDAGSGAETVTVSLPGAAAGDAGDGPTGRSVRIGRSGPGNDSGSPADHGRLVLPSGQTLEGWRQAGAPALAPAAGSSVVVVWEDGRPAASVDPEQGCTAYLAAEPATPIVAADPAFPWLLDTLIRACGPADGPPAGGTSAPATDTGAPLDAGALAVLSGAALSGGGAPAAVEVAALGGAPGRALWRVALLLALLVALAEAAIAYGGRRSG